MRATLCSSHLSSGWIAKRVEIGTQESGHPHTPPPQAPGRWKQPPRAPPQCPGAQILHRLCQLLPTPGSLHKTVSPTCGPTDFGGTEPGPWDIAPDRGTSTLAGPKFPKSCQLATPCVPPCPTHAPKTPPHAGHPVPAPPDPFSSCTPSPGPLKSLQGPRRCGVAGPSCSWHPPQARQPPTMLL